MSSTRATLEIIAPTVEEAIEKGLADLGLPREAVDVEVLDAGTRGLFGLGSRQARIRLSIQSGSTPEPQAAAPTPIEAAPEAIPASQPAPEGVAQPLETEEEDATLRVARETVSELLSKMKVHATVAARYGEQDHLKGRVPILVEVRGDDLSILIGKRAETLNALQYISGLMVGKELQSPVTLVVDVEGYRSRRASQLRQLARRMAEQAIKTGRRQVLEPMPANERRVIHMELREHPDVNTESIGEEPHRKVTIVPKE
jgi:spoIIIJ-associated protein